VNRRRPTAAARRNIGTRWITVTASLLLAMASTAAAGQAGDPGPPVPVAHVDLARYAGLWYEVARLPNRFQKKCARGVTARYTLREDGRVGVINRCVGADGHVSEVSGVAEVVDSGTNARLKVSFFSVLGWRPFWGDYWILGLGDDYEYAVIGSPDRKYGWILARDASPAPEILEKAREVLERQGYDVGRFQPSAP
jgi:apolipoprotein D and lipocalin family protein